MRVLFGRGAHGPADNLDAELRYAELAGFEVARVDLDRLVSGVESGLFQGQIEGEVLYRGWMLSGEEYRVLQELLEDRGARLVVDADAYDDARLLPRWYPEIEGFTPPSTWVEGLAVDEAWELAHDELGPPPWLIKDHVKSAKEAWLEACFVDSGTSFEAFRECCERLEEERGESFEGGLVIRTFVEFDPLPFRLEDRQVIDEARLVFWEGIPISGGPYLDLPGATEVELSEFGWLGERISSPFFIADVARCQGEWTVIEINDGGTALIPEHLEPCRLYATISSTSR